MSIPSATPFASAPYGAQPVSLYAGQEGGPVTALSPKSTAIISPAARTASFVGGDVLNPCYAGAYLIFSVTANPGGAQTLELIVEGKDDITSTYYRIADVAASATPGGVYLIRPGAPAGPVADVLLGFNLPLPQTWRVRVVHSGAGSWTYALNATQLP